MNRWRLTPIFITALITFVLAVHPSAADPGKGKGHGKGHQKHSAEDHGDGKGPHHEIHYWYDSDDNWWQSIDKHVARGQFKVPPGHRPPAGLCRLWYPGVPPGQQPPPSDCATVRWQRDHAAYILYGDDGYDPRYDWTHVEEDYRRTIPHALLDTLLNGVL